MYNRPMYMQEGGFAGSFGSSINPSFGGDGLLENIQEQVSKNGDYLKLMQNRNQRGIGGNPADLHKKSQPGGGFNPGDIGLIPPEPPMVTGPGGDLPPNDMGFPPDMFGKINVDELNKQNPGIEQGFFESDEYKKFHYDPKNMVGTMDVRFSPYFGTQGSGSVGGAMDGAYERYLKRIGKSDLIGKTIPGLSDNPFNLNFIDNTYINDITKPIPGSDNFTSAPIQQFANGGLADMGRFGDNQMVHAQTGEMVVPQSILQENPQIGMGLNQALVNQGLDPQRQIVGSNAGSINPMTGQQEFFDLGKLLKKVAPIAIGAFAPQLAAGTALGGISPFLLRTGAGALASKIGGAKTKDALMAGLLSGGIGALTGGMGSEATKAGASQAGTAAKNALTDPIAERMGTGAFASEAAKKTATDAAAEAIKGVSKGSASPGFLNMLGIGDDTLASKFLSSGLGQGLSAGLIMQLLAGDDDEDIRPEFERRPFGFGGPGGKLGGITYANMGGEMGFPRRNGGIDPSEGSGRKDDVPAMLMAGEFVLTKDAVKGLGDGNQRKGIERAYNMMDNLEARA